MNKFFLGLISTTLVTTGFAANNSNTLSEQEAYRLGSQLATSNKDVSDALKQGINDAKRDERESQNRSTERRQNQDNTQESNSSRRNNTEQRRDERESQNRSTERRQNQDNTQENTSSRRNNTEQRRDERESQNRNNERRQDRESSQQNESKKNIEQQPNVSRNGLNDKTFFAENGRRLGIVTTDSGLQYQVLKAGLGRIPHLQHNVRISYEVKDINDKVISKQSDKFIRLNHLTPALADGIETMREKGKTRFFIPAGLNSDTKELGTSLPENVSLIIDLELQSIE